MSPDEAEQVAPKVPFTPRDRRQADVDLHYARRAFKERHGEYPPISDDTEAKVLRRHRAIERGES